MARITDSKIVENFEKEPKIGKSYYKMNKTTNQLEEIKITDIQYVFNKKVGSKSNFTKEQIKKLIDDGILFDDIEILKREAIKKVEDQFNIKLTEIKK